MGGVDEGYAYAQLRALADNADELYLVERWESRTASLFRYGKDLEPGVGDVVLKISPGWTRSHVESIAANSALLEGLSGHGAVVRVLGHNAENRAVLFDHVDGTDLVDVVSEHLRGGATDIAMSLFRAAGELLAAIHDHPPYQAEADGLDRPRHVAPHARRTILCAGDFACYNLRVAGLHETLVLLEPPAWQRPVPVTRDLAWFLYSAGRFDGSAPKAVTEAMRKAFLDGYRSTVRSGDMWRSGDDIALEVALRRMALAKRNLRIRRRLRNLAVN